MIHIRNLTPASLASLMIKSAEEERAARLLCKQPCEVYRDSQILVFTETQKERRPQ